MGVIYFFRDFDFKVEYELGILEVFLFLSYL